MSARTEALIIEGSNSSRKQRRWWLWNNCLLLPAEEISVIFLLRFAIRKKYFCVYTSSTASVLTTDAA